MKFSKILLKTISLLGLSSFFYGCDKFVSTSTPEMYGTPSADYEILGTVADSDSGNPLKGIRISIDYAGTNYRDTTYTDEKGSYRFSHKNIFPAYTTDGTIIKAEDIDGLENGGDFVTKTEKIDFTYSGKNGFYRGKAENKVDFKLDKKDK